MTKSKVEDRAGEEVKQDGLEIASIGALYSGPWDKKYWSCSRGKDRHPYPIGYQALRAHNGIGYKMEIQEGSRGPLFVVSSADGYFCSGQTPDIAWEKFQKKGCVRMNILNVKRFSSKIDGVEFFGFKNPFVQRLLRELVANVNGANDLNSMKPTLCSGSSGKEKMPVNHMCRDGCSYPDLLTLVSRPQITGKRSKRRTKDSEQANSDYYKRSRKLPPTQILKASKYVLDKSNHINESSMLSLLKDNVEESVPDQDVKHILSSECSKDDVVDEKQTSEDELPDRSHVNMMEKFDLTMGIGDTGGPSFLKHCPESPDVCGHSLYEPVTRDPVQDISGSTPVVVDKNNHSQEDEVAAADLVTSEMPVMETRLGVIDSSAMKLSSENSDFESAGEEMAKSMMTFLLPQAIPLLQKASKQKKIILARSETASFEMESKGEKLRTEELVSVPTLAPNHNDSAQPPNEKSVPGVEGAETRKHLSQVTSRVYSRKKVLNSTQSTRKYNKSLFKGTVEKTLVDSFVPKDFVLTEPLHSSEVYSVNFLPDGQQKNHLVSTETKLGGKTNGFVWENVTTTSQALLDNKCADKSHDEESMCLYPDEDSPGFLYASTLLIEKLEVGIDEEVAKHKDISEGKDYGLSNQNEPTVAEKCTLHATEVGINSDKNPHCSGLLGSTCAAKSHDQESMCLCQDEESPGFLYASTLLIEKLEVYIDEEVVKHMNISEEKRSKLSDQNEPTLSDKCLSHTPEPEINSAGNPHCSVVCYQELERMFLLGCYSLPMRVLNLWLSQNPTSISICVLCGHVTDKNMTLLVYSVDISEPKVGYPCLVGHTSVTLPIINNYWGREISLETTGIQLTPNGNSLVLLDGIRTPYCREGKTNCSCYTCTSHSIEENAVKVVQVKFGYASIVSKLKAVNHLHSILVCKPNHLVAVGESGRMHIWVMNSSWSVQNESYVLPSNESISPGIVELKKVPKFADLVVGHNGFGEFTIWNISIRSCISKFSSSRTSIHQFFPVCLFSRRTKGPTFNYEAEEHANEMMLATNKIFSETTEKLHLFGEDISICLFVLTEPDYDRNHDSVMYRQWKLALLADKMVTFGTPFDSSVCAIGASAGQGIIGTCDGLVYMWELSTGSKIGTLLRFNGARVTCIATDEMELGAVAVASSDKLLVYLQTRK